MHKLQINNYNVYRKDRLNQKGGGVLLYLHKSIKSTPCDELNRWDYTDLVLCTIQLDAEINILVGTVYRSPSSDKINNEKLLRLFEDAQTVAGSTHSHIIVMGDFNLPEIDYNSCTASASKDLFTLKFFNLTQNLI